MPVYPDLAGSTAALVEYYDEARVAAMSKMMKEMEFAHLRSRRIINGARPPFWRLVRRWLWTRENRRILETEARLNSKEH